MGRWDDGTADGKGGGRPGGLTNLTAVANNALVRLGRYTLVSWGP
jgi:hypothetical protein